MTISFRALQRFACVAAIASAVFSLCGCEGDGPASPFVAIPDSPLVFVVNGFAETLTLVRSDSLTADPGAVLLGNFPNDVAVDSGGDRIVIVDSEDNDLMIIAIEDSARVVRRIDLGQATNPWAVEVDGEGRAFTSLLLTGEVAKVDLDTGNEVWRVPVGRTPEGLLPIDDLLLVAITNFQYPEGFGPGEVAVLDAATGTVLRRVPVGTNPQALVRAPDGRVHVVCTGNFGAYEPPVAGSIFVLDDGVTSAIDSVAVGGSPSAVAITRGGTAYVAGAAGGLVAYDATTLALRAAPVLQGDNFFDVVWDAERDRLFVAQFSEDLLYVVDTRTDALITTILVGDGPLALSIRR